jgi:hypothetical protein
MGDINLLYETTMSSTVYKIKIFTARIAGELSSMTVAKYEEDDNEVRPILTPAGVPDFPRNGGEIWNCIHALGDYLLERSSRRSRTNKAPERMAIIWDLDRPRSECVDLSRGWVEHLVYSFSENRFRRTDTSAHIPEISPTHI